MSRLTTPEILKSTWSAAEVERLAAARAGDAAGAAAEIAKAIAEAEAVGLSSLLARYNDAQIPATAAEQPAVLQTMTAHLAMYSLARAFHTIAPGIERAYNDARAWFNAVAGGRADVGFAAAPAVDRSSPQILANKTRADMVFGNGGLDGW